MVRLPLDGRVRDSGQGEAGITRGQEVMILPPIRVWPRGDSHNEAQVKVTLPGRDWGTAHRVL